ncbi:hypothetical protein ACFOHS_04460 [Jhaorihella thermophila]
MQRFKAEGLEAFAGMSSDPANVTNRGHDWSNGWGVSEGMLWRPTEDGPSGRPIGPR